MTEQEWKEKYVRRLMERGDLTLSQAEDCFNAGEPMFPEYLSENPEDMAYLELSYSADC